MNINLPYKRIVHLIAFVFLLTSRLFAQPAPFNLSLEAFEIPELAGIQSYAFGQADGKWLVVGGRLDGLHRRQPPVSFDEQGNNLNLLVIDPQSRQKWAAPLSSLPVPVQEQLRSSNMEFYQSGDYLYCLGGYGYSPTADDHITYPYLTAIQVPAVVRAVMEGKDFKGAIRQVQDTAFQVTGGRLRKLNEVYHLLGGQKFMGRYNPMGPDRGPGFVQVYTNSIRRFTIDDNGKELKINHLESWTDTLNLHRRDYNAESQILADGQQGITMFSGVFQYGINLPFLNSVNVEQGKYYVNPSFLQYYNHYHCPTLPLYAQSSNEMHTLFFGGVARFYDSLGLLIQNNDVPFVKTISRVTRDAAGKMLEYKLPVEMPAYLGAAAEFIPNSNLPRYTNGVVKLDEIQGEKVLLGYIYGGINSSQPTIFWDNEGELSTANGQIFAVYLLPNDPTPHQLNEQGAGTLQLLAYPNLVRNLMEVKYRLTATQSVRIKLTDEAGKILINKRMKKQFLGVNTFTLPIKNLDKGGQFMLWLETPYEKAVQKIIVEP